MKRNFNPYIPRPQFTSFENTNLVKNERGFPMYVTPPFPYLPETNPYQRRPSPFYSIPPYPRQASAPYQRDQNVYHSNPRTYYHKYNSNVPIEHNTYESSLRTPVYKDDSLIHTVPTEYGTYRSSLRTAVYKDDSMMYTSTVPNYDQYLGENNYYSHQDKPHVRPSNDKTTGRNWYTIKRVKRPSRGETERTIYIPKSDETERTLYIPKSDETERTLYIPSSDETERTLYIPKSDETERALYIPSRPSSAPGSIVTDS